MARSAKNFIVFNNRRKKREREGNDSSETGFVNKFSVLYLYFSLNFYPIFINSLFLELFFFIFSSFLSLWHAFLYLHSPFSSLMTFNVKKDAKIYIMNRIKITILNDIYCYKTEKGGERKRILK